MSESTPVATRRVRPFRPANGTEGMIFDNVWCSRCRRDAAWRKNESAERCDILSRTLIYDINDPEYPVEWIEDDAPYPEDTRPRCTAFLAEDTVRSTYVSDEQQGELSL